MNAETRGRRGAGEIIVGDETGKYPVNETFGRISEPPAPRVVRHDQLEVFELSFKAAGRIFQLTKGFPSDERFSLTDQVRKSSRSVSANIAEGWRKRRYRAAFQSSLNVAEAEAAETQTWLRFAEECEYIPKNTANMLIAAYDSIIGKLVVMINNPDPWLLRGAKKSQ